MNFWFKLLGLVIVPGVLIALSVRQVICPFALIQVSDAGYINVFDCLTFIWMVSGVSILLRGRRRQTQV